jgi:hypothetical protein
LIRAHLDDAFRHARARGLAARRTRARSLSRATALSLAPLLAAFAGLVLLALGGAARTVGLVLVIAYAAALVLSGLHAAVRFRSLLVGSAEPAAVVATQAVYLVGFVRGLSRAQKPGSPS